MQWLADIFYRIKMMYEFRRKLKQTREEDPYIYK
jgi:hypothetical protein